jgi:probable rRNA maturation factor
LVTFNYTGTKRKVAHAKIVKAFLPKVFTREKKKLKNLSYIFCDDEYLLQINKQFLRHNYYTDIITFCLSGQGQPIEGEIYISTERVFENSRTYKVSYQEELKRVIIHGALHLCGYKDKMVNESMEMRKAEDMYLYIYKTAISRGTQK